MVHAIIYVLIAFTGFALQLAIYWAIDNSRFKLSNASENTKPARISWWYWPSLGITGTVIWSILKSIQFGHLISGNFALELLLGQMLGPLVFGSLGSIIFRRIKVYSSLWIVMVATFSMLFYGPMIGSAVMIMLGYQPGIGIPLIER